MTKALIYEGIKFLLQSSFSLARIIGKSDAEIKAMHESEFKRFTDNAPETLPDV